MYVNKSGVTKLEIIEIKNNIPILKCLCNNCGNNIEMYASHFYRGSNSCKCQIKNWKKERLYRIWENMITRCYNKNSPSFVTYGKKGIIICKEWKDNYLIFKEWALNNNYSKSLTLDRINYLGNYEPDNCRWVDYSIQANNKSNNINFTIDDITKSLKQWCEYLNINYKTNHKKYQKIGYIEMYKFLKEIYLNKANELKLTIKK